MISIIRKLKSITDFKVYWNDLSDPHWGYTYETNVDYEGYTYETNVDYEHEFCLYRLCFIWTTKN